MIKDYLERFEILDGCSVIRINDLDLSNYPVHDCSIERRSSSASINGLQS